MPPGCIRRSAHKKQRNRRAFGSAVCIYENPCFCNGLFQIFLILRMIDGNVIQRRLKSLYGV